MKTLFITSVIVLIAAWSYAAVFSPTVMTITNQAQIQYDFDGNSLTIPFTVNGTPAAVWLVINTHGQGNTIGVVRNGYLGWHYVSNIDTTVYISPRYEKSIGSTNIVWDGTDKDGNPVPLGTYDYYLWGYDDKTSRLRACDFIQGGRTWNSDATFVINEGTDGMPLAVPFLWGCYESYDYGYYSGDLGGDPFWSESGMHFKWLLGGDPHDITNLQTTHCNIFTPYAQQNDIDALDQGGPALNPYDYSIFYNCCRNATAKNSTMLKWQWVADGEAVLDEDWLGWDELEWEEGGVAIGVWSMKPTCWGDRNYIYVNSIGDNQILSEWNKLRCVSFDGEVVFDKAMHEQFFPNDNNLHSMINNAPNHLCFGKDPNQLVLVSCFGCFIEMIDTSRIIEAPDADYEEYNIWTNRNGDFFLDNNFEPDSSYPFSCLTDDNASHGNEFKRDTVDVDANGFTIMGISYSGLNSIAVMTQDGSGIAYGAFADNTISDDVNTNLGGRVIDYGSNFDGLYWSGPITEGMIPSGGGGGIGQHNINFIAFDSVHGIISNEPVAVEDENATAFSVTQNAPNPFNPTTSIYFTIPTSGHVTVDVYNVAGQKVDTLVNDVMSAGQHSLVWDASGFSAGIYFYTVKSGNFSKTMKMTLLK